MPSNNVYHLKALLADAEKRQYAVGSYAPRNVVMIGAILKAGEEAQSPLIVQISQVELEWAGVTPAQFAEGFYEHVRKLAPSVPVGLHLDHTWDLDVLRECAESGFTSVMVDASSKPLEENIAITRQAVEIAHAHGVCVEGELGRIFSSDSIETESDEELYTDPVEAELFVRETGVDALAVSVGTVHGVYKVRQPKIDLERIKAIRALTPVPLVLHGGSGTPSALIYQAIHLPGGGVSKVNVATDLELALLEATKLEKRLSDKELQCLPPDVLQRGAEAVQQVVFDKMVHYLCGGHMAEGFQVIDETCF